MSPYGEFKQGLGDFLRGLRWLRAHPKSLASLAVPSMMSLAAMLLGLWFFVTHGGDWFEAWFHWQRPASGMGSEMAADGWMGSDGRLASYGLIVLYYMALGLFYGIGLVVGGILSVLLATLLACPLYEMVSVAYERGLRQGAVDEISLWESLKSLKEEIKKVFLIILISLAVMAIPGLNLLGFVVAGFLVAWDLYDYPYARRGFPLRQRLGFLRQDFFRVLGFACWLMVPFASFLLIPLAVPGATHMALKRLGY